MYDTFHKFMFVFFSNNVVYIVVRQAINFEHVILCVHFSRRIQTSDNQGHSCLW